MPAKNIRDEVFWLFERSLKPKLEIVKKPVPKKIGVATVPGKPGGKALEEAITLAKTWKSELKIFAWDRYINELLGILNRTIAEEELLISRVKEKLSTVEIPFSLKRIISPSPEGIKKLIEEALQKEGSSLDQFIEQIKEAELNLLIAPIPMFEQEHDITQSLGSEIDVILRRSPKSLPLLFIPRKIKGDLNKVLVFTRPDALGVVGSRILQFFGKETEIILAGLIDQTIINAFELVRTVQSGKENKAELSVAEDLAETLASNLRGSLEQLATSIHKNVKSVNVHVLVRPDAITVKELVETHETANVLLSWQTMGDDIMDRFVEIYLRTLSHARVFIVRD